MCENCKSHVSDALYTNYPSLKRRKMGSGVSVSTFYSMKSYLLYLIAGVLVMVALATMDSPQNLSMRLFAPGIVVNP